MSRDKGPLICHGWQASRLCTKLGPHHIRQLIESSDSICPGCPQATASVVCQLSGAADARVKCALPPGVASPFSNYSNFAIYFDPLAR